MAGEEDVDLTFEEWVEDVLGFIPANLTDQQRAALQDVFDRLEEADAEEAGELTFDEWLVRMGYPNGDADLGDNETLRLNLQKLYEEYGEGEGPAPAVSASARLDADRRRIDQINAIHARHGFPGVEVYDTDRPNQKGQSMVAVAIREGWSAHRFERELLLTMREYGVPDRAS